MAGYWQASALAPFLVRPNQASVLIGASSLPLNLGLFQTLIDERSAEFDQAAAKAGYSVPIPSTASAYIVAQRIVRDGATADALRIIYTGPDPKYIDRFQAAYDNALAAIASDDRPLPGAPTDSTGSGRLFAVSAGGAASAVFTAVMGAPQDLGIPTDF